MKNLNQNETITSLKNIKINPKNQLVHYKQFKTHGVIMVRIKIFNYRPGVLKLGYADELKEVHEQAFEFRPQRDYMCIGFKV